MFYDSFQCAQGASWSLCQCPREIDIANCDTLSSLIRWHAVGQMKKLEKLNIEHCGTIIELFESQTINSSRDTEEGRSSGGTGTALTSPRLKNMPVVPQLSNLKVVRISECDLLQYVFTFSTLESLKQLKELSVHDCKATRVIVKKESGEQTTSSSPSSMVVLFPHLETLRLVNLPKLEGFFLGTNDFYCPLLTNVMVYDCPEMMVFMTYGQLKAPKLKYISTNLGMHSVEGDLNFHGSITHQDDQVPFFFLFF